MPAPPSHQISTVEWRAKDNMNTYAWLEKKIKKNTFCGQISNLSDSVCTRARFFASISPSKSKHPPPHRLIDHYCLILVLFRSFPFPSCFDSVPVPFLFSLLFLHSVLFFSERFCFVRPEYTYLVNDDHSRPITNHSSLVTNE